ncbi:MAG: class I SAM-dependent methyltransferase [Hyphomicrobiaceae bacterium]|nr:MAG: class I SAM-dependent methyltransferase [Hyphomicrobiaceae bacterium]
MFSVHSMGNDKVKKLRDGRSHAPREASAWISRFLPAAKGRGRMLDVAAGGGRHMRLGLHLGLAATGVDRNIEGLSDLAGRSDVEIIKADLEAGAPPPFAGRRFEAVVVTNYLWRPILPAIIEAVAADGILLYETFALGQERHGRPSNPRYLLKPNELLDFVHGKLFVAAFEDGFLEGPPGRRRRVQRIAAAGRLHPWVETAPLMLR